MRQSTQWAKHKITRRRVSLMVVGALSVITGYGLISSPRTATTGQLYHFLLNVMSLQSWGTVWIVVGSIALATAAFNPREDRGAFGLVSAMFALWSVGIFFGWVVYNVTRGWVSASTYFLALLLILVISGWPDEQ